jgi:hypothetical protein
MMKKVAVLCGILFVAGQVQAADKVDFAKQVRPIFADTCYKCHSAQKQKGKLRLDSVEAIMKGGKDGKVLEPGDPDKSEIYKRIILAKDDDDVMPPEGDLLPKERTSLIKQWIAEGANFGDWKSDANAVASTTKPQEQAAAAAPAEVQLPQVAAADPAALDKLRQGGALAMPLAQNTNLVEVDLNLNGDHVDDGFLAQLEPLSQQVHTLNLARTKVSDDGLKAVENLKNLRRLHLENTKITDAGLTHLKNLTNLEYLNLYGTQVTDSGVSELEGLKNLRALYLWQTKVTPDGVEKLKKALPQCQVNIGWEEPTKAEPAKAEAK